APLDRYRTTMAGIGAATRLERNPVADSGRHVRRNRSRILKDDQNAPDTPRVQRFEQKRAVPWAAASHIVANVEHGDGSSGRFSRHSDGVFNAHGCRAPAVDRLPGPPA